jgi:hypothetical protein
VSELLNRGIYCKDNISAVLNKTGTILESDGASGGIGEEDGLAGLAAKVLVIFEFKACKTGLICADKSEDVGGGAA